ncbi:GNAT family N-acetyltransferase [Acetonema longum]|uniref:GCN5-related N-acetyltransferase n=1 Tax=Acetonema longum DSM 6540 TaxID=1009370 RepID=F7NN31_9FIRM|nr:GCN5-related N-acetyltransferase [Acetonema longum DSM 6540]
MAPVLARLAYCSEAYWGYDDSYMEKFKAHYNLTEEFINKNPVFIMEENDRIIGFWGLHQADAGWELEYFYIAAEHIGRGFGGQLWHSLIDKCKENRIDYFEFVTSPQAVGFYEKMGAVTIGQVKSLISKERIIPKLRYTFESSIIPVRDGMEATVK